MRTPSEVAQSRLFFWFVLCLYLLASLLFTQEYFARTIEWRQATLEKMIRFDADTPFQYRVLAPLIVRGVVTATPLDAYAASKILTVVWTFCSLLSFRLLLRNFFSAGFAAVAALTLGYAMFWNYAALGIWRMPFDLPALVLFSLALSFLLQRRWMWFYGAFILGALNRETILAVTAATVLLSWKKDDLPAALRHAAVQMGIWVGVRVLLAFLFRENEGGQFQNQFAANMSNLLAGKITIRCFSRLEVCGFPPLRGGGSSMSAYGVFLRSPFPSSG